MEVSEPPRNHCPWYSNSYNVWGNAKFASSMYSTSYSNVDILWAYDGYGYGQSMDAHTDIVDVT